MMFKGALAGLVGVSAMTAAQAVEMRVTGRRPSMVPGHVACKLLGLRPKDDEALARISIRMHWAHGITKGLVRRRSAASASTVRRPPGLTSR